MARWVPEEQTNFARRLRREMTVGEATVWRALRGHRLGGAKFRRQMPVGPDVADFLRHPVKVIIERDGPTHDDPEQRVRDRRRDAWLRSQGYRVLHFPNDLAIAGTEILVQQIETARWQAGPI